MRIKCPYCGERDASEFTYLGDADREASRSRGADAPSAFFDYVYFRDNPAGPHGALVSRRAAAAPGSCVMRDTRTHEIDAASRASARPTVRRATSGAAQPFRLASGGVIDRTRTSRFTLRRPAAMPGFAGRHAGLGAARQRRAPGRPLVQISPAARHLHRRRPKSRMRWSSCARVRGASRTRARP